MKNAALWDLTACSLLKATSVSEEYFSILMIEVRAKQKITRFLLAACRKQRQNYKYVATAWRQYAGQDRNINIIHRTFETWAKF
jgi:hypothetical protein